MEKAENKSDITWNEYPVIGLLVAMMLSILDFSRDGFYQIIPVALFFVFTGMKENSRVLFIFVRRYWYFNLIVIGYLGYFRFVNKVATSDRWIISMFFVVFAGFVLVIRNEGDIEPAINKLWVFLFAIITLGIIKHLADHQTGYFLINDIDLAVTIIFAALTILFISDIKYKAAGAVLSLFSAIILINDGAINVNNITSFWRILPIYLQGGIRNILLGRGMLQAHDIVEDYSFNTFSSLLFDFGLIAFVFYVGLLVYAIVLIIRSKDVALRNMAILTCVTLIVSALHFLIYSVNAAFIVYLVVGMFMGNIPISGRKMMR
ncbi:hypothetical protein [Butyrivibrio sp. LC3010]|uniref:hypothetical protein n=1 Tax=Butyrivibrio sp. LC3010 TaxID=1280680 RepID=UPI0004046448|nr:hypothetical protein [Butyrivibrio sp. LC3010]